MIGYHIIYRLPPCSLPPCVFLACPEHCQPKKEYYGEEKHEDSYSAPKKEYYKEEKHEEYEVRGAHHCCRQVNCVTCQHAAYAYDAQVFYIDSAAVGDSPNMQLSCQTKAARTQTMCCFMCHLLLFTSASPRRSTMVRRSTRSLTTSTSPTRSTTMRRSTRR